MPATIPVRSSVKARLVTLLKAAGPLRADGQPVQVAYGWPARDLEHECIWIGAVRGAVEIDGLKSGRKRVRDTFDVDVWIVAATPGQLDPQAAEERCEELAGYVRDALADDPHLDALEGLTGGARVSQIDGPDAEPTDEGSTAIARVQVTCQTTLA